MMTPGEARGNWIGYALSPEGGETKNIISSAPEGYLFIVLPLPPVSPGVINVSNLRIWR